MTHRTPLPGSAAPQLAVKALGGADIEPSATSPEQFTLVLFYRGAHCPICRKQLEELAGKKAEFERAGIIVHAVSMDSEERAQRQKDEWAIGELAIGYGLSEASAREWGLFISQKEKDGEPERFAEPGLAVTYPDGRIYALYYQSVPFARPHFDDILSGLKFIIDKNYPVRGQIAA